MSVSITAHSSKPGGPHGQTLQRRRAKLPGKPSGVGRRRGGDRGGGRAAPAAALRRRHVGAEAASVAAAVKAAQAKLGSPYVWGAEGPSTFDCSGLMVWAWEKAGVKLPRTSQEQAKYGTA